MSNHQHTTMKQGDHHHDKGWGSKCVCVSSPRVGIFIYNNNEGQGLRCSISSPWFLFFIIIVIYKYTTIHHQHTTKLHKKGLNNGLYCHSGPGFPFFPFFPFFSIFSFLLACLHLDTLAHIWAHSKKSKLQNKKCIQVVPNIVK